MKAADPDRNAMAKLTLPADEAKALSVRERVLLFCIASGTDWQKASVTGGERSIRGVTGVGS
jgi:hypothetical protein